MIAGLSFASSPDFTFSIRSSSTQPPETDPDTRPSSRMTSSAPTGRGAEPHVLTIVASVTRWPAAIQACALLRTSMSTLSMNCSHELLLRTPNEGRGRPKGGQAGAQAACLYVGAAVGNINR